MAFKRSKPVLQDYFNLPNPGLRAYFQHVVAGNQEIYRPPFWSKRNPREVVRMWRAIEDRSDVPAKHPDLYKFDGEMEAKIGPLSFQVPLKERFPSIESYYTLPELPSVPLEQDAINQTIDEFSMGIKLNLRSEEETISKMRLSTNSGAPYFTKRRSVVSKTVPITIIGNEQRLPGGNYQLAAVLGWRGQEGGPSIKDVKQRDVWMMPLGLNIKELQWYQVAIEHIQRFNLIPAYVSMDAVDTAITELFATKRRSDQVICTDFSKMDHHFNADMQSAARSIWSGLMADCEPVRIWLDTIFPLKFDIPLICSEDVMYTGHHGMGSGSGGTNADESVVHRALQYEAANSINTVLNQHSQCLGDDGLLSAPGLTVEDVIRSYTRHGQEMNPDKQYVSTHDCVYLRRWHGEDLRVQGTMVGVYSPFRALGRLLYQERFYDPEVWGPKMVTLRAWSIIENCHFHPCFEEFVDFCIKGDKYRLGLDIPGFIDEIGTIAAEATDLIPDFLGYTKTLQGADASGIQNWSIYKYLKSLA